MRLVQFSLNLSIQKKHTQTQTQTHLQTLLLILWSTGNFDHLEKPRLHRPLPQIHKSLRSSHGLQKYEFVLDFESIATSSQGDQHSHAASSGDRLPSFYFCLQSGHFLGALNLLKLQCMQWKLSTHIIQQRFL